MSFKDLKKNSKNSLETFKNQTQSEGKKSFNDDRFWKLITDDADVADVTLRFLPPPEGEEVPYAMYHQHFFKNPETGKMYIQKCPTTIGGECPACQANSELWNTNVKANQDIVRTRKRHTKYVANVYIVNDPKQPECNGKVYLFEFGKTIFDMISSALNPEFDGDTPINPFDLWTGANFRLRSRRVEGQRNYGKSKFEEPSALADSDDKLEAIWKNEYPLKEFTDPATFKPYDELKKKWEWAMGASPLASVDADLDDDEEFETKKPVVKKKAVEESDEDDLAEFEKMLED